MALATLSDATMLEPATPAIEGTALVPDGHADGSGASAGKAETPSRSAGAATGASGEGAVDGISGAEGLVGYEPGSPAPPVTGTNGPAGSMGPGGGAGPLGFEEMRTPLSHDLAATAHLQTTSVRQVGRGPSLPGAARGPPPPSSASMVTAAAGTAPPQVVHLDLDGARGVTYEGPITVRGIDVPAFVAPAAVRGQEAAVGESLKAGLDALFAGQGVIFTLQQPEPGSEYSTIYIGGTGASFAEYGMLWGLSEKVDLGNRDPSDVAFVFSERIPSVARTAAGYGVELARYVAHEAGHLLGFEHAWIPSAHDGSAGPLAEVAWKPYTHVEIAKDIRIDLLDDGRLEIKGTLPDGTTFTNTYDVHPRVLEALRKYPSFYYAGAVGPDGLPDVTYGQRTIHPVDTGTWLARIFDMAWAAQTSPAFTDTERLQILAFAYGYATHASGDFFGHTLVNEFTEGVFPSWIDIIGNAAGGETEDLANMLRHNFFEDFMNQATPRFDADSDRGLVSSGDISSTTSAGIVFDAPIRFIYESLLKPFPGDPSAAADTGQVALDVVQADPSGPLLFKRRDGGDFGQDGFLAGMQIFTFGFANQANDGRFVVKSVQSSVPGGRLDLLEVHPRHDSAGVVLPLAAELGSGDEALVTRGERGPILDVFFDLQLGVDAAYDLLAQQTGSTLPLAAGQTARQYFDDLARELTALLLDGDPATTPSGAQLALLAKAYLRSWSEAIDDGIANWGQFGLATSKALFDADNVRYWQNYLERNQGADVDPSRGATEGEIGIVDAIIAELDDPNHDGSFSDSFIDRHLLPMLGTPKLLSELGSLLRDAVGIVDELLLPPLRLLLNPIQEAIADVRAVVDAFIKVVIRERFGIDVEQLELLDKLGSKMDLKSIVVNGHRIPIFKANDRERIERLMGIESHAIPFDLPVEAIPGVEFWRDPTAGLHPNVEFDKQKFAPYADSVTLSKMLLLQELNPLTGARLTGTATTSCGGGQLSKLMNDALGAFASGSAGYCYDWTKLNMIGTHGGNVLTTTLPIPSPRAAFDPATAVDSAANTIASSVLAALENGHPVRYVPGATGPALRYQREGNVHEFTGAVTYYVRGAGSGTVTLHATRADAVYGGPALDLDATGASGADHAFVVRIIGESTKLAFPNGVAMPTLHGDYVLDQRPWLRLIDGDHNWRADSRTTLSELFRVHLPGAGTDTATWLADGLAPGTYRAYATWLYNVTQRIDDPACDDGDLASVVACLEGDMDDRIETALADPTFVDNRPLRPAHDAPYTIYSGGSKLATVLVDQSVFAGYDEPNAYEHGDLLFTLLDTVQLETTVRVELGTSPNGHVVAGPLLLVSENGQVVRLERKVDPTTLAVTPVACTPGAAGQRGYCDTGHWHDMHYEGGSGNFPMWKSELLRPVWRFYYRDWQNGSLNFPDVGDPVADDPNDPSDPSPAVPEAHLSFVTPFDLPTTVVPTGHNLTVTGTDQRDFFGTTVISSVVGDGLGLSDTVTITVHSISTGAAMIHADRTANAFVRATGDFVAERFAVGQQVQARGFAFNDGAYTVVAVTPTRLTVAERLVSGDVTGTGDELLSSASKLIVAGPIGGGGLTDVTLVADEIAVLAGVTISSRTVAADADPRTADSVGDSGTVTLRGAQILLGTGAALVAHATGSHMGGDVAVLAEQTADARFEVSLARGIRLVGPHARVEVGSEVELRGRDVIVTATAVAGAEADLADALNGLIRVVNDLILRVTAVPAELRALAELPNLANLVVPAHLQDEPAAVTAAAAAAGEVVRKAIEDDGILGLGLTPPQIGSVTLASFSAVFTRANARVDVLAGAKPQADRNVYLGASAEATADHGTDGRPLKLNYANAASSAIVAIDNGAVVKAKSDVFVQATTHTTLSLRTETLNTGNVAGASLSFGKTRAVARTQVEPGASITARDVHFVAGSDNEISNTAFAAGSADSGVVGIGASVAAGFYASTAETLVAGTVEASGNVTLEARSLGLANSTRAVTIVAGDPGPSKALETINAFLAGLDLTFELAGEPIDPTGGKDLTAPALGITLGAAIALTETENRAAALIDDGADFKVRGNLLVHALAEMRPRISAVAGASAAPSVAVGGAVAWSKVANQATAFVGYGALVDVDHRLEVDADAWIVDPLPLFDPNPVLADLDVVSGTAMILDAGEEATRIARELRAGLAPIRGHLRAALGDGTRIGTSFVHTAAGSATAIGGGVNYVDAYNLAAAAIASGALVNQRPQAAAFDQDVVLDARATVEVTNVAGLASAISLGSGGDPGRTTGVGGYFSAIAVDNYARAYIDDLARVRARRDVLVRSDVRSELLNAAAAGGEARDLAIDGAFGLVILGHESLAFIEDRARVHAERVALTAEDDGVVTNAAGAIAEAGSSVGVGAAFTLMAAPNALRDRAPADRAPAPQPGVRVFEQFNAAVEAVARGLTGGELLGGSATRAFVGDAVHAMGARGTGGVTGAVEVRSPLVIDARSALRAWTLGVAGAATTGANFDGRGGEASVRGLGFGYGLSGAVAFNSLRHTVEGFLRDVALVRAPAVRVTATDAPIAAASAGALVFGDTAALGGALARNGLFSATRAFTQDVGIRTSALELTADARPHLLTYADGGADTRGAGTLAGSVTALDVRNAAEAAVG
ncbi:MAG: zinc dependent phospholipase C family protein, partial [Actinomycetota bacterium]|nr:zinc dependent phospholipase C family protein [Actinomycetota bacterium]